MEVLYNYWYLFLTFFHSFIEAITVDQLVDVVVGNRQYKPCLYLYNKIDTVTIEEVRHPLQYVLEKLINSAPSIS